MFFKDSCYYLDEGYWFDIYSSMREAVALAEKDKIETCEKKMKAAEELKSAEDIETKLRYEWAVSVLKYNDALLEVCDQLAAMK